VSLPTPPVGAERMAQRLLEVVRGLVHPEVDRAPPAEAC